jgi:hypothetical protein
MMKVLENLRVMEAEIHMKLAPIEDTYAVLSKYGVRVRTEELEQVEMMRQKWERVKETSATTMGASSSSSVWVAWLGWGLMLGADLLQRLAPTMKQKLVGDIEIFQRDVKRFKHEVRFLPAHACLASLLILARSTTRAAPVSPVWRRVWPASG